MLRFGRRSSIKPKNPPSGYLTKCLERIQQAKSIKDDSLNGIQKCLGFRGGTYFRFEGSRIPLNDDEMNVFRREFSVIAKKLKDKQLKEKMSHL